MELKATAVALFISACMCIRISECQCPQPPQTVEENELYHVDCYDSNVTIFSALPVKLADVVIPGKTLFLYGYEVGMSQRLVEVQVLQWQ